MTTAIGVHFVEFIRVEVYDPRQLLFARAMPPAPPPPASPAASMSPRALGLLCAATVCGAFGVTFATMLALVG